MKKHDSLLNISFRILQQLGENSHAVISEIPSDIRGRSSISLAISLRKTLVTSMMIPLVEAITFLVYDIQQQSKSARDWRENAIVVDGWMNDAYSAQHHAQWKYGYNYKNQCINIKQLTIRNMFCIF